MIVIDLEIVFPPVLFIRNTLKKITDQQNTFNIVISFNILINLNLFHVYPYLITLFSTIFKFSRNKFKTFENWSKFLIKRTKFFPQSVPYDKDRRKYLI
jgi:hypothetical protein